MVRWNSAALSFKKNKKAKWTYTKVFYLNLPSHRRSSSNDEYWRKCCLFIQKLVLTNSSLSFSVVCILCFCRMIKGVLSTNYIDEGLSLMGTSPSALSNHWIIRVQSFDPFPNIYNRQRQTARVISLSIRWWVLDIDICLCTHTYIHADVQEYPVYKDVTSSLYLLARIRS